MEKISNTIELAVLLQQAINQGEGIDKELQERHPTSSKRLLDFLKK